VARKSLWPEIEKRLPEIAKWAKAGIWEKDMAANLGIALATFNVYKNKYSALSDVLKNGRRPLIKKLENNLLKMAFGYKITEKKEYTTIDKDGNKVTNIEKFTKEVGPSLGATCFALKNFDSDHFQDNPAMAKIKKLEYELKKKMAEKDLW